MLILIGPRPTWCATSIAWRTFATGKSTPFSALNLSSSSESTETVMRLSPASFKARALAGGWGVVVLSPHFSAALLARDLGDTGPDMDRTFEYALTYRRDTVTAAAQQLLLRVAPRPAGHPRLTSASPTASSPFAAVSFDRN